MKLIPLQNKYIKLLDIALKCLETVTYSKALSILFIKVFSFLTRQFPTII